MKAIKHNELRLIANLQQCASAFVALYYDSDDKSLYMLTRSSEKSDIGIPFIMASVSKSEVLDYIDRKIRLRNVYTGKKYQIAYPDLTKGITVDETSAIRKSTMTSTGKFDPQFCSDSVKIKIFLNKMPNPNC